MSLPAPSESPAPVRMAASPCGALHVAVAGETATLTPAGALYLQRYGLLAAGDLHLEKGSSFAARGQLLPPYDTRATLDRLDAELERWRPKTLVLLGDSFHDPRALARLAPDDARRLGELARRVELVWIAGNHDAEGLDRLAGTVIDQLSVGGLTLRHEPLPGAQAGEVAGHLHPCAKVSGGVGRGGGVRRRAFVTDGARLILPAFGAYTGGLNVLDPAYDGLFAQPPLAVALGRGRVHPLRWAALRPD